MTTINREIRKMDAAKPLTAHTLAERYGELLDRALCDGDPRWLSDLWDEAVQREIDRDPEAHRAIVERAFERFIASRRPGPRF